MLSKLSAHGFFHKFQACLKVTARTHFNMCLSQDHLAFQDICRRFAVKELQPLAAQLDKEGRFPTNEMKKLAEVGLLAMNVPTEWGGCGHDKLSLAIGVEEISRACAGTGAIVSIHNSLFINLLSQYCNEEQKKRFLEPCIQEGRVGCFALSEADAGSDVVNLSTQAHEEGDCYVLNGKKSWVTNGPESKFAIIFATVDKSLKHKGIGAFVVPVPSIGLILGQKEEKMGIRAASVCDMILDNVKIPKQNLIGKVGEGFKIAMKQLDEGRIGIASQALGIAQASLEEAIKYAACRRVRGQTLNNYQAVKMRIADMSMRVEVARLLVWRAASTCDKEGANTKYTSMAKLAASEAATFVSHNAIQIMGGMGFLTAMPVERHYRDARVTEIYGGISDIQKFIISDAIVKEYSK